MAGHPTRQTAVRYRSALGPPCWIPKRGAKLESQTNQRGNQRVSQRVPRRRRTAKAGARSPTPACPLSGWGASPPGRRCGSRRVWRRAATAAWRPCSSARGAAAQAPPSGTGTSRAAAETRRGCTRPRNRAAPSCRRRRGRAGGKSASRSGPAPHPTPKWSLRGAKEGMQQGEGGGRTVAPSTPGWTPSAHGCERWT